MPNKHQRDKVSSNSYKKTSTSNKGGGYWVTCETDMGPVPRGTPGMAIKDCMKFPDDSGVDCVLFWANHHVDSGKKDGNVWILGEWSKCNVLHGPRSAWPGGKKAMKSTEKLLNDIFKKGNHVTVLMALDLLMKAGGTGTSIIDGKGEGGWVFDVPNVVSPCSTESLEERMGAVSF
jgi:hypothetical protein